MNRKTVSMLSLLLGLIQIPSSTLQLEHQEIMSASRDEIPTRVCKTESCLEHPEIVMDPKREFTAHGRSLEILTSLSWPLQDCTFTTLALQDNIQAILRHEASLNKNTQAPDILSAEEIEVDKFVEAVQLKDIIQPIPERNVTAALMNALKAGEDAIRNKISIEQTIRDANVTFEEKAPSRMHQKSFKRTDAISTNISNLGFIVGEATADFALRFELDKQSIKALPLMEPTEACHELETQFSRPLSETCDPMKRFRTLDGSCNNIKNPLWGASFTPFRRDLCADYDDGVKTFRKSVTGDELPSPRLISTTINNAPSEDSLSFTILHMTFGQFLDHDLTATPVGRGGAYPGEEEFLLKCCDEYGRLHPECAPIEIPLDDPFYKWYNQTCMEFSRSAPAGDCHFGPRNQMNQHSAYLDGSVMYSVKQDRGNELRAHVNGFLARQVTADGERLLSPDKNLDDGCNTVDMANEGKYCFKAGDDRVNEQMLLTFFQTLWAREHNRVARKLKKHNKHWKDERLFQEARRIVVAELQQITYFEYLPTILGKDLMASSKMLPLEGKERTDDYNPELNAGIANNFATAAYRFGHSLVSDHLLSVTRHDQTTVTELSTLFFNPFKLYTNDAVSNVARGGLNLPEKKMDSHFSDEITNKLFRGEGPFGLDLFSLNIQRGRDHGLPPYNDWREFCNLPRASSFDDLLVNMKPEIVEALSQAYNGKVEDVDLYAGGVSENAIPGGILGHTFTCLVHNQFFLMKYADRFWYEYKGSPGAFTRVQLRQLHRVRLARIMCNNVPELKRIQKFPFLKPGPKNPKVSCNKIRRYSLKPWKVKTIN